MLSFSKFINEAWTNDIEPSSKEASVTSNRTYNTPQAFHSKAKKIGEINGLEIHRADIGGGSTHFTWDPKTKLVHHVVRASQVTQENGKTRLKYLSAHRRDTSHVSMGQVYGHLVKNHDTEFIGTGHSPGAQKMWDRFHSDSGLEVHGVHPDGSTTKLEKGDKRYASKKDMSPEARKIGKMELLLKKA